MQVHAGWSGLDHRMNEYGNTGGHNKTERAYPVSRESSHYRQELQFLCVFPCLRPSLFFLLEVERGIRVVLRSNLSLC